MLVTVGTDGFTDWVQIPDGQKFTLGRISVLNLVTKLASGIFEARKALQSFLDTGQALIAVDWDHMWKLFEPIRARWASDNGPFMAAANRSLQGTDRVSETSRNTAMPTIREDLAALESHVAALNKHAGHISPQKMAEGVAILVKLANKIKSPNQSKNETYYGYGTPPLYEVGKEAATDKEGGKIPPQFLENIKKKKEEAKGKGDEGDKDQGKDQGKKDQGKEANLRLTYDTYQTNATTAQGIIALAEETEAQIDKLAAEGKKFKVAQAKADLHAVTSKVAGILKDTDLTQEWVQADLQKLAARADYLHGLFFPKS